MGNGVIFSSWGRSTNLLLGSSQNGSISFMASGVTLTTNFLSGLGSFYIQPNTLLTNEILHIKGRIINNIINTGAHSGLSIPVLFVGYSGAETIVASFNDPGSLFFSGTTNSSVTYNLDWYSNSLNYGSTLGVYLGGSFMIFNPFNESKNLSGIITNINLLATNY